MHAILCVFYYIRVGNDCFRNSKCRKQQQIYVGDVLLSCSQLFSHICRQGGLHCFLDLDFELDMQGWSHGNCLVFGIVAVYPAFCHHGNGDGIPKEKQENPKVLKKPGKKTFFFLVSL